MKRPSRHSWTIGAAIIALVTGATGAALARTSANTAQITPAQVKKLAKSVIIRAQKGIYCFVGLTTAPNALGSRP